MMKRFALILAAALPSLSALAAPILPTEDGMTWRYHMTEETGEGFRIAGVSAEQDKLQLPVVYRRTGSRDVDGKPLLAFEMHRGGLVTNTDLMNVDENGITCVARVNQNGEVTKLSPPQMIVPPLVKGTGWDYDTVLGEAKVHQHCNVVGEEDVDLAAGKFRASKIHIEQTEPNVMSEDRWFVRGVGIVKDVTTTRNEDGDLMKRITLELQEKPKVAPRPEVNTKKLSASVSAEAVGAPMSEISSAAEKICARWQGNGLRKGAKVRVVWIAQNIGEIAAPDYTIDEATTTATAPDSRGVFTLSRPEDGWAPGDYRVEFYVDDALIETAKLKITK
jgi:hypothetical protein